MDNIKTPRSTFFKFTTERPVAILMVVIGISVFGYISYQQLPLNLMPDMTYPSLTVRTEYEGTAPEEIETTISRPVEQELGVVNNLVSISSISKAEQSDVILEFTWNTDMDKATSDVREKLDQVFLPEDADRPLILRYDPSLDPIMRLGLYGDASLTYLRYLADEEIKRNLETVEGVAAVKVKGGLEEEIRVELNEQKLTLIKMDIQLVRDRLAQENINLAGGNLKEGQTEYLVRTLNEFKSVKEIQEVVIGRYNGVDIKVKDVGKVYRTGKEREIITRIEGRESVEIEVFKEADANIVAVAERVKHRLYGTPEQQAFVEQLKKQEEQAKEAKEKKEEKKKAAPPQGGRGGGRPGTMLQKMTNFLTYSLPECIQIETLSDQSIFIKNSIDEVKNTAIMGGLLAIIVLFVFLRKLAPTLIIGLAIPISIVATFAPMKIFHVSLNIMSLGGLALGIGMLVDNSIVVLESIARCRDEGDDIISATIRGVGEVGGAVMASTLTTIAVFFPIVFVEGVAGQIFGDLALAVVFSLLASLAVALFLIPMLSSRRIDAFSQGADIRAIPKKYILDFETKEKVDVLFKEDHPKYAIQRSHEIIMLLLKSLLSWLLKTIKVFTALLVSVSKQLLSFILTIAQPVFTVLLSLLWIIPAFRPWFRNRKKYSDFAVNFSQNGWVQSLSFINDVWQKYLAFNATKEIYSDLGKIKRSFHIKPIWKLILKIIILPFQLFYFLIKYFIYTFTEIVFRIFHAFVMLLGLFIYMFVLVLRLIFTPITKIIVFLFDKTYAVIDKAYPKIMQKSLDNKFVLIGVVIVLFLFSVYVVAPRLGSELIPEVHQGEFYVELTYPIGTPVEKTDERTLPVAEMIQKIPGVEKVATSSGTDKSATTETDEGEHTSRITVSLSAKSNLEAEEERVISEIRHRMTAFSGVQSNIARPAIFSFKTPIEVHIKGYNLTALQRLSRQMEAIMSEIPGVEDAKASLQRGNPEVQIFYDRTVLARYGLNVLSVAAIVRNKVRGDVATEFKDEDRKIDILVRLREEDKQSIDDLRRLIINPGAERPIPLQAVADIRVNEGPSEIRRIDQQRTAVITANVAPGADLKTVSQKIYDAIGQLNIPSDFSFEIAGQNKEMETSLNSLMMALGLAIFLVYIVMASQFESLIHPFIIIFTIPMAMIGVFIFLYILSIPLSIVVFLGMIMLAGIVVNNAIVLVDYINHLRSSGMEKIQAIIQGGQVRLRPILMTTATTVLGLLPMAIGMGDGAEIRTPMAITVIIGLITSTILTLVVIPTVYALVDRKK
ncbi:MAG: efflux RND transporter permease subunit [Calditrichaceae bacterium]